MSDEAAPKGKKPRSPVERAVVWGGILVLLVVVLLELRASQGHSNTVAALTELSGGGENEIAFADAEATIGWMPSKTTVADTDAEINYRYNWQSIFKSGQFVVHLVASKDEPPALLRYYTGDDDPMAAQPNKSPTKGPSAEEAAKMFTTGGGGGGGGGSREDSDRPDMDDSEGDEDADDSEGDSSDESAAASDDDAGSDEGSN